MAFVRHGVLTASVVSSIELPARRFYTVEVTNVDGEDRIYWRMTKVGDTADPTVEGDDCEVLPASMCALEVKVGAGTSLTVELISEGTPAFSVRAE